MPSVINNLLFMKNLLSPSHFIAIYVEDSFNPKLNELISTHFNTINKQLRKVDVQFIYLPELLKNKKIREITGYHRPQLSQEFEQLSIISEIYQQLKATMPRPFQGEGLVWTDSSYDYPLSGFKLNPQTEFQPQLDEFSKLLTTDSKVIELNELIFRYSEKLQTPTLQDNETVNFFEYNQHFNDKTFQLANEIRKKIDKLKESGALILLNDILEGILVKKPGLSILYITNDYRIFLKDYEMREVKMAPLTKALYLLYLRYPEGIKFKELIDYRDELLSIYKNVTTHEDMNRAKERITALTDPLNNPLNEKCSRIRSAC